MKIMPLMNDICLNLWFHFCFATLKVTILGQTSKTSYVFFESFTRQKCFFHLSLSNSNMKLLMKLSTSVLYMAR
jgi:hypothetical protein